MRNGMASWDKKAAHFCVIGPMVEWRESKQTRKVAKSSSFEAEVTLLRPTGSSTLIYWIWDGEDFEKC